jgi:hypothetical protein
VCGGIGPRQADVAQGAQVSIGEIFWWLLLAGVLVWGWDYIQQFRR